MAALRIVIGRDPAGVAYPVYVGESGVEAREACKKDTRAVTFETLTGAIGVRKNNPNFAPSAAKKK